MNIQRKLLTEEQRKIICKKHKNCNGCPLLLTIAYEQYCYENVKMFEQSIENYWNEEIEVDFAIPKMPKPTDIRPVTIKQVYNKATIISNGEEFEAYAPPIIGTLDVSTGYVTLSDSNKEKE